MCTHCCQGGPGQSVAVCSVSPWSGPGQRVAVCTHCCQGGPGQRVAVCSVSPWSGPGQRVAVCTHCCQGGPGQRVAMCTYCCQGGPGQRVAVCSVSPCCDEAKSGFDGDYLSAGEWGSVIWEGDAGGGLTSGGGELCMCISGQYI